MDVKFLIILVYNVLFSGYASGQNTGNCQIDTISNASYSTFSIQLSDDKINEEIFASPYSGSLTVVSFNHPASTTGPDVSKFFDILSNDTYFSIKTTQEMENFDKEMAKTQGSIISQLTVNLACDGGSSTLTLLVQIDDVNEYPPEFHEDSYVYEVASPLMPPTDFTVYGSTVTVTDLDFSNQDVTFTIDPDHFSIITYTTGTSKDYTAIFSAKRIIQLTGETTYTLTATDSGTPSLSSTVQITLIPNASLSLDKPIFSSSSYSFNYTIVEDQPVLTPLDGQIILQSNRLGDSPQFTLSGDSADSFNAPTVDATTGIVELTLNGPLTTSSSIIALTLTVETDNPAVTNIVINLPEVRLSFTKHIYAGTYDAELKTVTLDEPIVVETVGIGSTPSVVFAEDLAGNFELVPRDDRYVVEVKTELTGDELRQLPVGLRMTATADGESDEAYLLLNSTIVETFAFLQTRYSARYSAEESAVELDAPMELAGGLGNVTAAVIDDSLSEYFGLTCDDDTCTIYQKVPLPQTILDSQAELVLTILAQDDYGYTAETILAVTVPQGPKFEKTLYTANYPDSGEGTFGFDEELKFQNDEDPTSITVNLDNYGDYLQVVYDEEWQVKILKPLNVTGKSIVMTMSASKSGAVNEGESVLVLQLPDDTKETLIFSSPFYRVQYDEDGGVMYFIPSVEFENADVDSVNVSVSGDYAYIFSPEIKNNKWQLDLNSPLNLSVIESNKELVMTIVAEDEDGNTGTAALIVDLPTLRYPEFSETYYTGTYRDGAVDLDEPIAVDGVDDGVVVEVEERYSEYFELVLYDSTKYNLTVLKELESIGDEVVIGLKAKDSIGSATSTVVLSVVGEVAPEFSQARYRATYDSETGKISVDSPITITNKDDLSSIDVSLEEDDYSSNFALTHSDDGWELSLASQPDSDDSLFIFTLKAAETDNDNHGEAVLIVQFTREPPTFSSTYYTGQYLRTNDTDTVTLDQDIVVNSQDAESVVLALENYDEVFKVSFDAATNKCEVKVTKNVDEDVVKTSKELIVGLLVTDQYGTGSSTLVLRLPQYEAPEFSQPSYKVTYINETELTVDSPIAITNKDMNSVVVTVEETSYATNFELTPNSSTSSWSFAVTSLPESAEYPLVLTLKATETSSDAYSEATLVFDVSSEENDVAPIFSRPHYFAVYSEGALTSDRIAITNKDAATLRLVLDNYGDNFRFDLDEGTGEWSIGVNEELSDDVVDNNSELVLTITAREDGNVNVGVATLIVHLPSANASLDALVIDEVHYDAEYDTSGEKPVVRLAHNITVSSDGDLTNLKVKLESNDYFSLEETDSGYVVHVDTEIPEEVLKDGNSLVYTITATSDVREAQATLVVHLPVVSADEAIKFSDVLYSATYVEKDETVTLTPNGDITIETDLGDDDYTVEIEEASEYKSYFTVGHFNKSVTVFLVVDKLPDSISDFVPLILVAKATGSDAQSSAVLNIDITRDVEEFYIEQPLYSGQYFVENSTLTVDQIRIVSGRSIDDISISIDDENFDYDKIDGGVITLKLKDGNALPEDVVSGTFIPVIVTASVDDSALSATTVLNIEIVQADVTTGKLSFPNVITSGTYEVVDDKPTLTLAGIPLETDQSAEDIQLTIDEDYSDYFTPSYAEGEVTITANAVIPSATLVDLPSIVFVVKASTEDGALSSETVVNLRVIGSSSDDDVISIANPLYNADYFETNSTLKADDIQIVTDSAVDEIEIKIENDNGDGEYFTYELTAEKILRLSLLGASLPTDLLESSSFIPLVISATVGESSATTIVNVRIIKSDDDSSTGYVTFPTILNTGTYQVTDDGADLKLDAITLSTDQEDGNIEVKITDDYASYFDVSYSDHSITVTATTPIPTETLSALTSVLFTIEASIIDTSQVAQTVVSLEVIKSSNEGDVISIGKPLYGADYFETNSTLVADEIEIITDSTDTIEIKIENENGNEEYFTYELTAEKILRLSVSGTSLPSELVESSSFIPLVISATVGESSATTIVNVRIIKSDEDPSTGYVTFPIIINTGTYQVTDDGADLKLDVITLSTDQEDVDIEVKITDDYASYFDVSYSDHSIAVTATTPIPTETLSALTSVLFTIEASIKDTSKVAQTVVSLEVIKSSNEDDVISIGKPLYGADYFETNSTLVADEIQIITDSTDTIEIKIENENGNGEYFTYELSAEKILRLSLSGTSLPSDLVESSSFIPLVITATVGESSATTIVNVRIIKSDDDPSTGYVTFPTILNTGTYQVTDDGADLKLDAITLSTDQEDGDIEVKITDDYASYFDVSYSDHSITVTPTAPIPTETLSALTSVLFTIEASIIDTSKVAQTVVSLEVIKSSNEGDVISIGKLLYGADYFETNSTLVADEIQIITDSTDTIEIKIENENGNGEYFTYELTTEKVLHLSLSGNSLPSELVESSSLIPLVITATAGESSATTIVNVRIIKSDEDPSTGYVTFPSIINIGTYQVTDDGADLKLDSITLSTDQEDGNIEVKITDEYASNFDVSYSDHSITVTATTPIPTETLSALTSVLFTIEASIIDTLQVAQTVVSLEVIKSSNEGDVISIGKPLYGANYFETNSTLVADDIQIITDSTDTIEIKIENENGNGEYFTYELTTEKVLHLSLSGNSLPSELVESSSLIPLVITATAGESSATTIVNVRIIKSDEDPSTGYVTFPTIISTGTYQVTDDGANLQLDAITLSTDQEDGNIEVKITDDYASNFDVSYSDHSITVTATTPIPTETLSALTSVLFTIEASIKDTSKVAQTVVSLEVIKSGNEGDVISIGKPLYGADYFETNSTLVADEIQIITDSTDTIEIKIENEKGNGEYFTYELTTEKVLHLSLSGNSLPSELVESSSFLSLVITATVGESSARTIVNVRIIKSDEDPNTGYVTFPSLINTGTYQVTDDGANLQLDAITLSTDQEDGNIEVKITDGNLNDEINYFDLAYSDHSITVTATTPIPTETLSALVTVLFIIEASIKDTSQVARTLVSLDIIRDTQNSSTIRFEKVLHTAEYKVSDGKGKLEVKDTIKVQTDEEDIDISTSISDDGNGFSKYFKSSYSKNEFTVTLSDSLPNEAMKYSFIALTLTAVISGDSRAIAPRTYASAVLNVEIDGGGSNTGNDDDNDSFDKTPWIATVAVLASLLVLLLVAAGAFYFFKLRSKDYTDVDEELWKVRFAGTEKKKKASRGLTPVEARRPTAFEFNQLEEEEHDSSETSTDPERRKSVIFDDNVEKLEIDKVDEDEDQGEKRPGDAIGKA